MPQKKEHRTWKIVELFYKSYLSFRRIREQYEEKVDRYAAQAGLPRDKLELKADELAGLFEFRKLEELRDRYLWELKEHCHQVFRGHGTTDLLDRYVSDIFHEVSILKEELYTVERSAPVWARADAQRELTSIMEEAGRVFPQKIRHIHFLFENARGRLEKLLRNFREQKILTRSLFLNRKGFVSECYPDGIEGFYAIMYPENGPLEGYDRAGMSFFSSGFFKVAIEAFEEGLEYDRRRLSRRTPAQERIVKAMEEHMTKAREAQAAEEESGALSVGKE